MAHKKGVGSSKNGRESESKRLGVKIFGGQAARAGNIIIRQRGTAHNPGENVYLGKDHTLHAKVDGLVQFSKRRNNKSYVSVVPFESQRTNNYIKNPAIAGFFFDKKLPFIPMQSTHSDLEQSHILHYLEIFVS